jgi:hypothetical protein
MKVVYRRLALELHPDMAGAANDDFILLHDAYVRPGHPLALRPRHHLARIRTAARLQAIAAQLLGLASPKLGDRPALVDPASFDRELRPCEPHRRATMVAP